MNEEAEGRGNAGLRHRPVGNWIPSVPGRRFLCCIRSYDPAIEFYDQSREPDHVVRVA